MTKDIMDLGFDDIINQLHKEKSVNIVSDSQYAEIKPNGETVYAFRT